MTKNVMMGHRYDGGKSPLAGTVGLSPGTLQDALRLGKPEDTLIMPSSGTISTVFEVNTLLKKEFNITVAEFSALSERDKDRITRKLERKLRNVMSEAQRASTKLNELRLDQLVGKGLTPQQEADAEARTLLHETTLQVWSRGELTLEKPQASSLHHLVNYDAKAGDRKSFLKDTVKTQVIVIEHEWARAMPPSVRGEWRLPFERCCWEFRISGVRVLVFTFAEDVENPTMVLVYGKGGQWVSDDYVYRLGGDQCTGHVNSMFQRVHGSVKDAREFRRVVDLCWVNIRAACIMLEAPNVCEHEERRPSDQLVAKARRERVCEPRPYAVVRLMNMDRRRAYYRSAGGGSSGVRQGGHWRRGTWVHYDDQDSGKVQYVNEGGFIVSKTWRSWHFAGDPDRLVEKEYRL